eukprot:g2721.t1
MKGKTYTSLYPIAYVDATSSMTQAWIYGNLEKNILIVNFPGTDVSQWKDLMTNFDQSLTPLTEIVEDDLILKPKNSSEDAKVHQGYSHAYLSIRDILLQILYSICKWEEKWLIITTGHSLGGSLASLAAYDIANRKITDTKPHVAMFVYGPPAVGNQVFSASFQNSVPLGFHMVAYNDQVATSMCPDLKRVGKAFPMNSADMEDIKDVLDTIVKDDLSSSSKDNENILQSQNLKAIQGMLAHLEQNYFDVISKFVETVFSPKKAP